MEKLISPDTVGLIIQAISAIVIATITYVLSPVVVGKITRRKILNPYKPEDKETTPTEYHQPSKPRYAIVAGIKASTTFVLIGLLFSKSSCPVFSPTNATITSPMSSASEPRLVTV